MPGRRLRAVTLVAAILASLAVGVPGAHAVSPSVTCSGSEAATYNPGLQLTPRTVTLNVNATFGPCISTNPAISSGTAGTPPGGVPATLSCNSLLGTASGQAVIHWNNGTTTRYSFNRSSQTVLGQLITTASGPVIAGEFLGRSVSLTAVSPALNLLDCIRPSGLTSRTALVTLVIA
ncbi:MAG: hypothetical protein QOJ69_695 [Actinomycetota bacterium]|nr:hypothetical protein [Actinomycetota bacterium]